MKKLFSFFLLLISFQSFGQVGPPSGFTGINQKYNWIGGVFDSTLVMPKRDTIAAPSRIGEIRLKISDSTVYIALSLTAKKWYKLKADIPTGAGSGTVQSVAATIDGSVISVGGTPITNTGTLAFTWNGAGTDVVLGNGAYTPYTTLITGVTNPLYSPIWHGHIAADISNFVTAARSSFSAGTGITITDGVIAWDGSSSGITSFNGLLGTTQTLALDTNYSGVSSWNSTGTAHTLRLNLRRFITQDQLDDSAAAIRADMSTGAGVTDSIRNRYISIRSINDTSFAFQKWNGSALVEDTLVISLDNGSKGDISVNNGWTDWTINNGAVTNDKVATGIDAVKLADGSVSNAELQYINSLSGNAQTQIDGKQSALVSGTNIKTINSTSLLGSGDITIAGSVNNFRELKFKVGVTAGAPADGDSILVYPDYANKKLNVFREGELQFDSTSAGDYGYERSGDTIKFHPSLSANERIILQAYPDSNWTYDGLFVADTDAQELFDAIEGVSTLSGGAKTSLNTLISNWKAQVPFSDTYVMYPLTAGTEAGKKFNAVDPQDLDASHRLSFVGSNNNSTENGIIFQFGSGRANMHLQGLAGNNVAYILYISGSNSDNATAHIGAASNQEEFYAYVLDGGNYHSEVFQMGSNNVSGGNSGTVIANVTGCYIMTSNGTSIKIYKDGTEIWDSGASAGASMAASDLFLNIAFNISHKFHFAAVTKALTPTQVGNITTIVTNYVNSF